MARKTTASTASAAQTAGVSNPTRVICPKCGTEIAIPERESLMVGVAIGKNSNLGTIVLPAAEDQQSKKKKKPVTATEKIEALKAAGMDVSSLFSIPNDSTNAIYMPHDGMVAVLNEDDPEIAKILRAGDSPVYRLHRRWVMAQVFRMLNSNGGFTDALNNRGYYYQWKVLADEFHTQAVLKRKDPAMLAARTRWYNKSLLNTMIWDYLEKIKKATKEAKNKKYFMVYGHMCYRDTYERKVDGVRKIQRNLSAIKADDYAGLERCARDMHQTITCWCNVNWDMHQSSAFQNAYKGAGGYFTMENLIRFHKCRLTNNVGQRLDEYDSLKALDEYAAEASLNDEGYKMLGMLKALLKSEKIDIKKKIASWRKG